MEQIKRFRFPAIFCTALVLLALAAGVLINLLGGSGSATDHISMGQRYLNDLNYSEAILEFTNAIELNPGNRAARQGLADAYVGTNNYAFAADVLEDVQNPYRPDPELTQSLVDIYIASENYGKAVSLVNDLITQTDADEYYDQRQELLQTWNAGARVWAAGTDQELMIQDGAVVSRGRNALGQLGTANGLGQADYEQTEYASAEFPGTPKSVYCAGRTSYVLDTSGNLWACGENRWGQMGESYADTMPKAGWSQLTTSGDVVAAAGSPGRLIALCADGSLWEAGANAGQTLTRVAELGSVMQVDGGNRRVYALTANGGLYAFDDYNYGYVSNSGGWGQVASGVVDFQASDAGAVWLTEDGAIGAEYGLSAPTDWISNSDGTFKPNIEVVAVAGDGSNLLMLGSDGTLYMLSGGTMSASGELGHIIDLYYADGGIMIEMEDGSLMRLQDGRLQAV